MLAFFKVRGSTEVDNLSSGEGLVQFEHNVLRLEISMDDPLAVCVIQGTKECLDQSSRVVFCKVTRSHDCVE